MEVGAPLGQSCVASRRQWQRQRWRCRWHRPCRRLRHHRRRRHRGPVERCVLEAAPALSLVRQCESVRACSVHLCHISVHLCQHTSVCACACSHRASVCTCVSIHQCASVSACACVCAHACASVRLRGCAPAPALTHASACACTCAHSCVSVHSPQCARELVCACAYAHSCVSAHSCFACVSVRVAPARVSRLLRVRHHMPVYASHASHLCTPHACHTPVRVSQLCTPHACATLTPLRAPRLCAYVSQSRKW